jgi:RNA polymerase sigma factor for flagellar operon FliA
VHETEVARPVTFSLRDYGEDDRETGEVVQAVECISAPGEGIARSAKDRKAGETLREDDGVFLTTGKSPAIAAAVNRLIQQVAPRDSASLFPGETGTGKENAARGAISAETDQLVERHSDLVKRIAYHLAGRLPASVEVDDLIQAGMLGLLEAASNYSAARGASFETYAGIRIRGAMLDGLRKLDWAPRSVHRKARAVAAALRELEAEIGREARDCDVATRMGVSLEAYHKIIEDAAGCQIASLTTEAGEINAPDPEADPFRDMIDKCFRAALTEAIAGLPDRERTVLSLYYDDELNLKEIGTVLNVSESRICQIHGQALTRLQARLSGWRDRL